MYTNENTEHCVWSYGGRLLSSKKMDYNVMATTHMLINEKRDTELIEGAKLLLKTHGEKMKT
jgi:hypothetical protein